MEIIRSLISVLQRWIARYMVALDYANVREQRRTYTQNGMERRNDRRPKATVS